MTTTRLTIYDYLDLFSIGIFYIDKTKSTKFSLFLANLIICVQLVLFIPLMIYTLNIITGIIIIISVLLMALMNSISVNYTWLNDRLDKLLHSMFFGSTSNKEYFDFDDQYHNIISENINLPWWMFKLKYNISPVIYLSREGYDQ